MRARMLAALLLILSLCLCGCRFAAVETGSVRVETPTATPEAPPISEDGALAGVET